MIVSRVFQVYSRQQGFTCQLLRKEVGGAALVLSEGASPRRFALMEPSEAVLVDAGADAELSDSASSDEGDAAPRLLVSPSLALPKPSWRATLPRGTRLLTRAPREVEAARAELEHPGLTATLLAGPGGELRGAEGASWRSVAGASAVESVPGSAGVWFGRPAKGAVAARRWDPSETLADAQEWRLLLEEHGRRRFVDLWTGCDHGAAVAGWRPLAAGTAAERLAVYERVRSSHCGGQACSHVVVLDPLRGGARALEKDGLSWRSLPHFSEEDPLASGHGLLFAAVGCPWPRAAPPPRVVHVPGEGWKEEAEEDVPETEEEADEEPDSEEEDAAGEAEDADVPEDGEEEEAVEEEDEAEVAAGATAQRPKRQGKTALLLGALLAGALAEKAEPGLLPEAAGASRALGELSMRRRLPHTLPLKAAAVMRGSEIARVRHYGARQAEVWLKGLLRTRRSCECGGGEAVAALVRDSSGGLRETWLCCSCHRSSLPCCEAATSVAQCPEDLGPADWWVRFDLSPGGLAEAGHDARTLPLLALELAESLAWLFEGTGRLLKVQALGEQRSLLGAEEAVLALAAWTSGPQAEEEMEAHLLTLVRSAAVTQLGAQELRGLRRVPGRELRVAGPGRELRKLPLSRVDGFAAAAQALGLQAAGVARASQRPEAASAALAAALASSSGKVRAPRSLEGTLERGSARGFLTSALTGRPLVAHRAQEAQLLGASCLGPSAVRLLALAPGQRGDSAPARLFMTPDEQDRATALLSRKRPREEALHTLREGKARLLVAAREGWEAVEELRPVKRRDPTALRRSWGGKAGSDEAAFL